MRTPDVERKRLPQRQHARAKLAQRSGTESQAPFFLRDLAATAAFIRWLAESTFERGLAGPRIMAAAPRRRPGGAFPPGRWSGSGGAVVAPALARPRDSLCR